MARSFGILFRRADDVAGVIGSFGLIRTVAVISSSADAVSSRLAACCSVRQERSAAADEISVVPEPTAEVLADRIFIISCCIGRKCRLATALREDAAQGTFSWIDPDDCETSYQSPFYGIVRSKSHPIPVGADMQNIVTYEHHGKKYSATFSLAKNIVKTKSDFGTKAAPVGKSPPSLVARWLLGEMVRAAH